MALDNKSKINVINKRSTEYTASFPNGEYIVWMPSLNGMYDEQEIELKLVQWLHNNTGTFKNGHLFIDNEEARKRLGLETSEVKAFTMSREEIEKYLKGNLAQLKKLEDYKDNKGLISEVINVAKELKIQNHTKLSYLSELSGVPVELLTESIEE